MGNDKVAMSTKSCEIHVVCSVQPMSLDVRNEEHCLELVTQVRAGRVLIEANPQRCTLTDEERSLVLGVVLEELLSWVPSLPGTQRLRALVVFDEVYGYLPPHPANPPTKRPLVSLMKQARAFGVGVVLATQNPMDLDYRALGNAGLWRVGRLQTDADRARVLDGMVTSGSVALKPNDLADIVKRLAPRWFLVRDAHAQQGLALVQPRWTMSYMRGPMTRLEIRHARELLGQNPATPPLRLVVNGAG